MPHKFSAWTHLSIFDQSEHKHWTQSVTNTWPWWVKSNFIPTCKNWLNFRARRQFEILKVRPQADHPICLRHRDATRDMWSHTCNATLGFIQVIGKNASQILHLLIQNVNIMQEKWIKITYRMFLASCSAFLWRCQSLETAPPPHPPTRSARSGHHG